MKMVKIWCECGQYYALTEIQYNDFEYGICGTLNCIKCKNKLVPMDKEINCLVEEVDVDGEDPGWNEVLWIKMVKNIRENKNIGSNVNLVIPGDMKIV